MTIHPKVVSTAGGSGLGAAVTIIIIWILSLFQIPVPEDVAQAFTAIFGVLVGLIAGYVTPNPTPAAQPQNGQS